MLEDERHDAELARIPPAGIPPGVDPGGERPPDGVFYFRIFAGVVLGISALLVISGTTLLTRGMAHGGAADGDTLLAAFEIAFGLALVVPYAIVLFGGKRAWVHTVGTVALGLSTLLVCCLPVSLPLLIAWVNPETRRYYATPRD